jgi:very-short-patch-repair endonuclease
VRVERSPGVSRSSIADKPILDCDVAGSRIQFARTQRQGAGLAEARLWERLRSGKIDGWKFRRQHPVGRYFADFACERLRLIIEIDGGVHRLDDVVFRDHLRQMELESLGWTVLRFTSEEVLANPDKVLAAIRTHAADF